MWELSTLRTYRTGLRKLYQVHWARPHWTTTQAWDAQVTAELQNGSSPSVVRTILSAAAWAGTLGYLDKPIPTGMGKLPKAAAKRQTRAPPEWGSFAALAEMTEAANTPMEWCVVAAAVLSTIMGLRISAAATLKLRHINGLARRVTFWDQKINHKWYTGPLSDYGATWAMALHYTAAKKLGRTPDQFIFSGTRQLERIMAKLLQHSPNKTLRWHGWRRLCAVTLAAAGSSTQKIKGWCRWRSTSTARQYMDCPQAERISKNPWVPLPPNPTKKAPVSRAAKRSTGDLATDRNHQQMR